MSDVSLMPVPSDQDATTCAHCGAALVADQRYCLSCGQPASPVRLAFLDVLQNDRAAGVAPATLELMPTGYAPLADRSEIGQRGANGWLRRNTGLLALLGVLVLCLIAGLLVGHWVSQGNKTPAKQVVEVKGLSGLAAAPAAATTSTPAATTSTPSESKGAAKEAAEAKRSEEKESKVEKAPPPPKKVAPTKIKKLTSSSGAQHTKEINELGATPIETG
ncbi:MAG TPA: hypothetical protein VGX69_01260 [Solirubrobacteraceae bacterium]|jgi:hypothetical protein|nr:hypothetical protein [Solirubrobacteraceae bacterium]